MILLDANVLLRFLLNDHESSKKARELFYYYGKGELHATDDVWLEVVHVLESVHGFSRRKIADNLSHLFPVVSLSLPIYLQLAIEIYCHSRSDWVDCCLVARNRLENIAVISYDKWVIKNLHEVPLPPPMLRSREVEYV